MRTACLFNLVAAVGLAGSAAAAEAADYFAHCTVSGGKARGYVTVTSFDSVTVSGQVTIYVYDDDGDEIDRDSGYEYAYIYHDTELVRETAVDDEAVSCRLDVSGAVDDPPPPPPPPTIRYSSFCKIEGGEAQGWVTVHDFAALTIDGYVKFYVFDADGDVIDDDSSYEYEYIYHDTEMVDSLSVDDEARSCAFDVSGAVKS